MPLATVQRSCYREVSGLPYMEHRTLIDTKWGWSEFAKDAHIFPDWNDAETHVRDLKLQGEKKCYPFVYSETEQKKQEIRSQLRHKSPQEIFEELQKRNLA